MLTVENSGFTDGDEAKIKALKDIGVSMASLVWNSENSLAYPNAEIKNSGKRLKERGRRAVELFDGLKIIIDVSHLSDGGVDEILERRKIPLVASHSNARALCGHRRNLTDKQIKKSRRRRSDRRKFLQKIFKSYNPKVKDEVFDSFCEDFYEVAKEIHGLNERIWRMIITDMLFNYDEKGYLEAGAKDNGIKRKQFAVIANVIINKIRAKN